MLHCIVAQRQAEGAESWAQLQSRHTHRHAGTNTAHLLRWHWGLLGSPHIDLHLNSDAGHGVQYRCGSMPVMSAAVLLYC